MVSNEDIFQVKAQATFFAVINGPPSIHFKGALLISLSRESAPSFAPQILFGINRHLRCARSAVLGRSPATYRVICSFDLVLWLSFDDVPCGVVLYFIALHIF